MTYTFQGVRLGVVNILWDEIASKSDGSGGHGGGEKSKGLHGAHGVEVVVDRGEVVVV
jgi:hypothetical protein